MEGGLFQQLLVLLGVFQITPTKCLLPTHQEKMSRSLKYRIRMGDLF